MKQQGLHVVFGTGPLGLATARALVAQDKQVRMVNRTGMAEAPAGVELVRGDAFDPESTKEATRNAAVVYQCAQPAYHQWPEFFPRLQAGVVAGAAANGAKLVVAENLYMYGPVSKPMTEDLPSSATTRKGRTRAEMSAALLAAHQNGTVQVTIARGSDFFGPHVRDSGLGERIFGRAVTGKAVQVIGNPDLPHSYTFIDDFGQALALLGERDEALGQIWHVPNSETLTTRQVITMIYEELGRPAQISLVGRTMLRMVGLFVPGARETVEMLYEFEESFVVDCGKYTRAFDVKATPMREAIRQTVAWYKCQEHS